MLDNLSRRQLFRGAGASLAGTTLGAFGFGGIEAAHAAAIRPFKLDRMVETRNTCPYCAVACGVIMYAPAPGVAGAKRSLTHIEGDPDHPTNRGTLCPKGAALLDFVKAPTRLTAPRYRGPGEKEFREVTWDWALDQIVRRFKDDRDKNFIAASKDGVTATPCTTTAFLPASATTNETAFVTYKVVRSTGGVVFDNQARD